MLQITAWDAVIVFQNLAIFFGIEQPQRRFKHRRAFDGVERHFFHQLFQPLRQRRFSAAHRTQQIENLFLFFQPLRGMFEIGNDLLDGFLHPIKFLKGGINFKNFILEDAR